MITKAVRLYGKEDLRLEEFELPEIREDEILVRLVTDSVCMSTNKLVMMGQENARAHEDMEHNPCIMGHEFSGEILQVGAKWKEKFHAGERFILQPALVCQSLNQIVPLMNQFLQSAKKKFPYPIILLFLRVTPSFSGENSITHQSIHGLVMQSSIQFYL